MAEYLWHLENITQPGRDTPRLSNISLDINPGITAVIGQSGAGKTSLLNLLVNFEKPATGHIDFNPPAVNPPLPPGEGRGEGDQPINPGTPTYNQLPFFWTPADFGLWPHLTVQKHLQYVTSDQSRINHLLTDFDLTDITGAKPASLSQGERSRLAVARALAANPQILVMDEPLIHVDPARINQYWQHIRNHIAATDCSLVFTTHSPKNVLAHAQHVVCLDRGRLQYQGPVTDLYYHPKSENHARYLGDVNWFTPDQAKQWITGTTNGTHAYRPEQLAVTKDPDSPLVIRNATFAGSVARATIENSQTSEHRTIHHRPAGPILKPGDRVRIRYLLTLLLAACLFLFACDQKSDIATLPVKQFNTWTVPPAENRLPAPRSVTIGPNDEVVALDNAGRILVYDHTGQLLRQWSMPTNEDGNPEGACWLKDGRIAVADTHYYRVIFFDQQGNLLSTLGNQGTDPGQFEFPVSIVQDDNENIYVAEYGGNDRIQKFTPDGQFITTFGSVGTGPGQFQRAAGMIWYDNKIYIADASNHRIQIYSDSGQFIEQLGQSASPENKPLTFRFPYDIAIGRDNCLYIIEWGAGCVTQTTLAGELLASFGKPGTATNQFRTPWGIAVDSQNRLRIADTQNRRIVELLF